MFVVVFENCAEERVPEGNIITGSCMAEEPDPEMPLGERRMSLFD
jgi:hypothetical protein